MYRPILFVLLVNVFHGELTNIAAQDLKFLGCYRDGDPRLLNGLKVEYSQLTPGHCAQYCAARSFPLAGLQFRKECFCGHSVNDGQLAKAGDCHYPCPGNSSLICGGDWRISVYETGFKPDESIQAKYLGCYNDPSANSRLMRGAREDFNGRMTNLMCQHFCKQSGMKYAGTEFSYECFCSNNRPTLKSLADEGDCDEKCHGASNEICGGKLRLSVYDISSDDKTNEVESMYRGCYPGGTQIKLLNGARNDLNSLTPIYCVSFCYNKGNTMAGVQLGNQCYCGDSLGNALKTSETYCNVPCKGNALLQCGGSTHMNVYYTGVPDKNAVPKFYYLGCFKDTKERTLVGISKISKSLTSKTCVEFCFRKNYVYAGTEYGEECFCSDDLSASEKVGEHECNIKCIGDTSQRCGGSWRLSIYSTGISDYIETITTRCEDSETIFGANKFCKGQVIFIEDFNSTAIDQNKWAYSVYMPTAPDYQFVTFKNKKENIYIKDGNLVIKPTILDDNTVKRGTVELENCTAYLQSAECSRTAVSFSILPPVESAMISTISSFSFQYGKIEIRAKLPSGDWLVPALWLRPKLESYGSFYSSGRVVLAMSRGNADLNCGGRDLSRRTLESGVIAGVKETMAKKMLEMKLTEGWYAKFHTFTFTWSSDSFSFSVDGGKENYILTKGQRMNDVLNFGGDAPWKSGGVTAPFDKQFYISLGLFAGGMADFPDGCTSGEYEKPWKNMVVKAMANFWQANDRWFKTWTDEDSALLIDYVKVTAV